MGLAPSRPRSLAPEFGGNQHVYLLVVLFPRPRIVDTSRVCDIKQRPTFVQENHPRPVKMASSAPAALVPPTTSTSVSSSRNHSQHSGSSAGPSVACTDGIVTDGIVRITKRLSSGNKQKRYLFTAQAVFPGPSPTSCSDGGPASAVSSGTTSDSNSAHFPGEHFDNYSVVNLLLRFPASLRDAAPPRQRTPRDLHAGDVVRLRVRTFDEEVLDVLKFMRLESWASTFSGAARASTGGVGATSSSAATPGFAAPQLLPPAPKRSLSKKLPALILQCSKPRAERVAEFFGGVVASDCAQDRLVYVFEDGELREDESGRTNDFKDRLLALRLALVVRDPDRRRGDTSESKFLSTHADHLNDHQIPSWDPNDDYPVPFFLHSVVHRIYFITEPPVVSLMEALQCLIDRSKTAGMPHRYLCYPKCLGTTLARYNYTSYGRVLVFWAGLQGSKRTSFLAAKTLFHGGSPPVGKMEQLFMYRVYYAEKFRFQKCPHRAQLQQNRDTATAMMALNHLHNGQHNGSSSYSEGAGGPARNGRFRGADSFVYADGLFWMGFRTPHFVVPARDSVAVVRGYYSKVAEACERVLRMEEETFSNDAGSSNETKDVFQNLPQTPPGRGTTSRGSRQDLLTAALVDERASSPKTAPLQNGAVGPPAAPSSPKNSASTKTATSPFLPPLWQQRYLRRCRCLIVGAGRGASTSCLSSLFGIKKKIVVDPAEHIFKRPPGGVVSRLSAGAGGDTVEHWQMTGLEAVSRLLSAVKVPGDLFADSADTGTPTTDGDGRGSREETLDHSSSRHPPRCRGEESLIERSTTTKEKIPLQPAKEPQKHDNIPTFAVFLCYAHENLRDSVELFRRALPLFERPTLCVITFAESQSTGTSTSDAGLGQLLGQLREMGLVNLDQVQLFANAKHQQTLVGEVL